MHLGRPNWAFIVFAVPFCLTACDPTGSTSASSWEAKASTIEERRHSALLSEASDLTLPYIRVVGRENLPPNRDKLLRGIKLLDEALEIAPNRWQTLHMQGMAWEALGDYERFYDRLSKAHKFAPNELAVRRVLIHAMLETRRFDEARNLSVDALSRWPDDQFIGSNHALVLLFNDNLEAAQAQAERHLDRYPDDKEAAIILVLVWQIQSGDRPMPRNLAELEGRDG